MAEFALILPVLMTLFLGVVEITRYVLIVQKAEKLAHSVADLSAQSATLSRATLDQVFTAASDIMNPYATGVNSHIMVSSLYRAPGANNAVANWRYACGGTLASTTSLGAVGATPTMPTAFTFDSRENIIASEVFYEFSPLLANPWFGTRTIYRSAFYAPRFGALITAPQ